MNLESEIISKRNGHKKVAKLLRLLDVLQLHLRKTERIPTSHRDSPASLKAVEESPSMTLGPTSPPKLLYSSTLPAFSAVGSIYLSLLGTTTETGLNTASKPRQLFIFVAVVSEQLQS